MKKPSERMEEICRSLGIKDKITSDKEACLKLTICVEAIVKYLDEEYERNKPCEHKNNYRDDLACYDVCKDCGVIGLFS